MSKIVIAILFCFGFLQAKGKEDILKDQVCNILPSLEGWCSKEKALNFIDLVLEVKPNVCVEIGVFGGASLFPVASALKFLGKGIVVGIDPWERSECIKHYHPIKERDDYIWWSCLDFNNIYDSYCMMLRRNALGDFCISIKSTSERAASFLKDIDILYIDGNANEQVTVQDVTLYLPRVLSGGYIWINNAHWPQREKAIYLLGESCDFVKSIDNGSCLLFKKK
ncbi:MAG TPA: class I SAM-dependent methyltransferase [Chlamydiales bacterium]|nr:class I SAM-dependent methyltransferase [Chlamydiales bacterium]